MAPEVATADGAGTDQLGWKTELPVSLRSNEAFAPYKTKEEFLNGHIAAVTRSKELEGKLAGSILKLPDNASEEERNVYLMELGRPETADGYELDGEKPEEPGWKEWKQEFFKLGLPANTAKALSAVYNRRINALVEAYKANVQKMNADAETTLKTEWGDKYSSNVELVRRLWKTNVDGDLDKDFDAQTSTVRTAIMRFIFKMAAKTGEDISPAGAQQRTAQGDPFDPKTFYSKSPAPPVTR